MSYQESEYKISHSEIKILIVDDEELLKEAICAQLETENYQIITASNGQEAIDKTKLHKPNLILLDVIMPIMDGIETCKIIHSLPESKYTDIIMLTQLSDSESIDNAFQAGAVDFIIKPINWLILKQRIEYALYNQQLNHSLFTKQEELNTTRQLANIGEIRIDVNTNKIQLSKLACNILHFNYDTKYFLDDIYSMIHPDELYHVTYTIEDAIKNSSHFKVEYSIIVENFLTIILVHQGEYVTERNTSWLLGSLQDVTEIRNTKNDLEYQKSYDSLTNLANRSTFHLQVKHLLSNPPIDSLFSIIILGLDNFSEINNNIGMDGGDFVLKTLADRFRNFESRGYVVSRYGGDVFAFLVTNIKHITDSDLVIQEIMNLVSKPITYEHHGSFLTASIGIILFSLDENSPSNLIRSAEAAMLYSQKEGGNQFTYRTPSMDETIKKRLKLLKNIRSGLESNEFIPYYQPQIDALTGEIMGMEALARWINPTQGVIPPDEFIPIAEESNLIIEIERQIIRKAIQTTHKWHKLGFKLRISVNLSAQHIEDDSLLPFLIEIFHETAFPAAYLEVEITERIAISNTEVCINKLNQLRAIGIKTSMDDFGTGYSSLSQLQKLPLDTLKVDQSFVRSIRSLNDDSERGNSDNGAIAATVIALSHNLNLSVIAEGVETDFQSKFLISKGCDVLQGYLYGKPMTEAEFEKLITQKTKFSMVNVMK